jgi:hypothetical protein
MSLEDQESDMSFLDAPEEGQEPLKNEEEILEDENGEQEQQEEEQAAVEADVVGESDMDAGDYAVDPEPAEGEVQEAVDVDLDLAVDAPDGEEGFDLNAVEEEDPVADDDDAPAYGEQEPEEEEEVPPPDGDDADMDEETPELEPEVEEKTFSDPSTASSSSSQAVVSNTVPVTEPEAGEETEPEPEAGAAVDEPVLDDTEEQEPEEEEDDRVVRDAAELIQKNFRGHMGRLQVQRHIADEEAAFVAREEKVAKEEEQQDAKGEIMSCDVFDHVSVVLCESRILHHMYIINLVYTQHTHSHRQWRLPGRTRRGRGECALRRECARGRHPVLRRTRTGCGCRRAVCGRGHCCTSVSRPAVIAAAASLQTQAR